MRFGDRVCPATGGGSGIGRATSERFAAEGGAWTWTRTTAARRSAPSARRAAGREERPPMAGSRRMSGRRSRRRGWLDVLVNNAAMMTFPPIVELGEEGRDRLLAVNLRSAFLCCTYGPPPMAGGAIVNVSSLHAHETTANVVPDAASEGGWRRSRGGRAGSAPRGGCGSTAWRRGR